MKTALSVGITGIMLIATGSVPSAQGVINPFPNEQKAMHPRFDLVNLRPDTLETRIGGMGWLSDGRLLLAIRTEGKQGPVPGYVLILDNVLSGDKKQITSKKYFSGLDEPLGLAVVNDVVYVIDRSSIKKLVDANKDGVAESSVDIGPNHLPPGPRANTHPYAFDLVYHDGFFYHEFGVWEGKSPYKGHMMKTSLDGSSQVSVANGLRHSNGTGFGPDGELFTTDNQGDYLPANKFINVRKGRFYGHQGSDPYPGIPNPAVESPAAVYIPEGEAGNSPSQPFYLTTGMFAGQMLMGDVRYGNIHRVFLEKVNDEFQGALFHFAGGLESGINRMSLGPDGAIYLGGIGQVDGNCCWAALSGKEFGLAKIKENNTAVFDMLAVRSYKGKFEIEFTQPVGAGAELAAAYQVKMWRYKPTSDYGGPRIDQKNLVVKTVQVSQDKKKVVLEIDALEAKSIVYIKLLNVKSASGQTAWSTETWYTLNAINPEIVVRVEPRNFREKARMTFNMAGPGQVMAHINVGEDYLITIKDAAGAVRETLRGNGPGDHALGLSLSSGVYTASLRSESASFSKILLVP